MISYRLLGIVLLLIVIILLCSGILVLWKRAVDQPLSRIMPFIPIVAISERNNRRIIYQAVVIKVVDGDTLDMRVNVPIPWGKMDMILLVSERVRVCCIDTPESLKSQAQCGKELQLGQQAKDYLAEILKPTTQVLLSHVSRDKYGRLLAQVADLSGQDIGEMMIGKGLARAYHGKTKSSWCNNEH